MKAYTKIYLNHFGYDESDFIPCELCEGKSVDIHHIWARSIKGELVNDINNLMALCRICHTIYGDKKQWRDMLQRVHNKKLKLI